MAKFLLSPGVAIREVDNSQYATTTSTGNVTAIIGYAEKGPFDPTTVGSVEDFNLTYGKTLSEFPYLAQAAYKYFDQGSSLLVVRAGNDQDPDMVPSAAQYTSKKIRLNPTKSDPALGSQTFKFAGSVLPEGSFTPNTDYSFQVVADYNAFSKAMTLNEFKVSSAETSNNIHLDGNGQPAATGSTVPSPFVYNDKEVFKLAFDAASPNKFTAYYKRINKQNGSTDEYIGTGTRTGSSAFDTLSVDMSIFRQNNSYVAVSTDTLHFEGSYQAVVKGTANLNSGYDWSATGAAQSFSIKLGTTTTLLTLSEKATSIDDVIDQLNSAFANASIDSKVQAFRFVQTSDAPTGPGATAYVGIKHLAGPEDGFTLISGAGVANALSTLGLTAGVYQDSNSVFGIFHAELSSNSYTWGPNGYDMLFDGMIIGSLTKITQSAVSFQDQATVTVKSPASGSWDRAVLLSAINTGLSNAYSGYTYPACEGVASIDATGKIKISTKNAAANGIAIVSITSGVGNSLVGLLKGTDDSVAGKPSQDIGEVLITLRSAERGSYGTKLSLVTETKQVQTGATTSVTYHNAYVYYDGKEVSNYQRVSWDDPTSSKYIVTLLANDAYLNLDVVDEDNDNGLIPLPDGTWSLADDQLPTNILSTQAEVVSYTKGTNGWEMSGGAITSMSADFVNALQKISNPEVYEFNLVYAPPAFDSVVQNAIQNLCESRRDCFGVLDAAPFGLGLAVAQNLSFVSEVNDRTSNLNSSYVAAYWPWLHDYDSDNKQYVWLPPSIYALTQMVYTDNVSDPWFATAGLTRGKITASDIEYSPTASERDILYGDTAIVNPIVKFVNEGIAIWGQKTAQRTNTATNRINVRRLMIYAEKLIAKMARGFLFEPNDSANWTAFARQANSILEPIRQRRGLYTYSVVCDSTTNTADLVNQNIMAGKIFLQPTKTIEMIQVDFTIDAYGNTTVSES